MARRKKVVQPASSPTPAGMGQDLSAARAITLEARKTLQKNGCSVQEMKPDIYGVSIRESLVLQYLIGVDAMPLRRPICISGFEGSGKSALAWCMTAMYMHKAKAPYTLYLQVEDKTNFQNVRGQLRNDLLFDLIIVDPGKTVSSVSKTVNNYTELMTQEVGPGTPHCVLLDSISNLVPDDELKAFEEDGDASSAAGYGDARRAGAVMRFLRAYLASLEKNHALPLIIYTGHLKEKMASKEGGGNKRPSYLPAEMTIAGGKTKDFVNTVTLNVAKRSVPSKRSQEDLAKGTRADMSISTIKSAMAQGGMSIEVSMYTRIGINRRYEAGDILNWDRSQADTDIAVTSGDDQPDEETEDKVRRPYVMFDWDSALINLLVKRATKDHDSSHFAAQLDEIVKFSGTSGRYTCKQLGLEGVSKEQLGRAFHEDQAIYRGLQDILGISTIKKVF